MKDEMKQEYFNLKMRWILQEAENMAQYGGIGALYASEREASGYVDGDKPTTQEMDAALYDVDKILPVGVCPCSV